MPVLFNILNNQFRFMGLWGVARVPTLQALSALFMAGTAQKALNFL
jgi:hypothetical protein